MDVNKREYNYSSFEKFSFMPYDEMIFSQFVSKADQEKFLFIEGKIISRGKVNLNFIQFSDKAIKQAVKEFKPHPALAEHQQNLFGMVGTVVKYVEDNDGLKLYSIIPKTDKNKDFLELIQNDVAGLIRLSIGGVAFSIKCSICDEEVYEDYDHIIGKTYKFKTEKIVAYGIVDEWRTKESTFTIFPADTDTFQKETKFSMSFSTGFDELDVMLDERYKSQDSTTLINTNENTNGEVKMPKDDDKIVVDTAKTDLQFKELKTMVAEISQSMKDEMKTVSDKVDARFSTLDNEKKAGKIAELVALTDKDDTEKYLKMSSETIDALTVFALKNKKSEVPDESGLVDDTFRDSEKVTAGMRKDALSVMLGFKQTHSEMTEKYEKEYGVFGESMADKVNRVLGVKYAPKKD